MSSYASAAQSPSTDPFGKRVFPHAASLLLAPTAPATAAVAADGSATVVSAVTVAARYFYLMQVTPALHYTMGGLAIDERARVLTRAAAEATLVPVDGASASAAAGSEAAATVEGVFAAGEVTGGVHGRNRLGGNSLLDCVVFGRRAGRSAADFVFLG